MPKQLKEEIVVQSNELLEAPLFRTSLQLKIFSKIIVAIRENSNKDIYSFQIKDLLDDLELGLDNYSYNPVKIYPNLARNLITRLSHGFDSLSV